MVSFGQDAEPVDFGRVEELSERLIRTLNTISERNEYQAKNPLYIHRSLGANLAGEPNRGLI